MSCFMNILSKISQEENEIERQKEEKPLIKFSVVGLMITPEFQKCQYIVESLHKCYPKKYDEPELMPLLDLKWNEFLTNERRSKGGLLWTLKKPVAVYYNGQFMGDETTLSKYLSSRFILPVKDYYKMGRTALKNYFEKLMGQERKCIFLMVSIEKVILGSMVFLLYEDIVPKTCRLFLKRCKKLKGGYSDTPVHRIVESSWIQCGGHRLEEHRLPCENYAVSHDSRGVLSMCNSGRHKKNTTQFLITLERNTWMDNYYVAIGQLLHGDSVLSQIEKVPTKYQHPQKNVRIVRAGEFTLNLPKLVEGRYEHDLKGFLDHRMEEGNYKSYASKDELAVIEELEKEHIFHLESLDTDMESHQPMEMLPMKLLEELKIIPRKKSSCTFDVENCLACGCSHDVGKCMKI